MSASLALLTISHQSSAPPVVGFVFTCSTGVVDACPQATTIAAPPAPSADITARRVTWRALIPDAPLLHCDTVSATSPLLPGGVSMLGRAGLPVNCAAIARRPTRRALGFMGGQ